jgi:hypothetical protein
MQKLLAAAVDHPLLALVWADEEFPRAHTSDSNAAEHAGREARG